MKIFNTIAETRQYLDKMNTDGKTIGFVPTMGALHKGHLNLVKQAKKENDICVCSIFVNPIQFNNQDDLQKYPHQIDADISYLKELDCDVLFNPTVEEMYPEPDNSKFDFGQIENVMEGRNRPGHFNGVAIVVKKLFEIIQPTKAYFGKKDYQQLLIVKTLVQQYKLSPEIIGCDIVREDNGLAMSSRNERLDFWKRKEAEFIYESLQGAKQMKEYLSPVQLKKWVLERFRNKDMFVLEYFEVADSKTLQPLEKWEDSDSSIAFIVAHVDGVRLIDNIELN